jgi:hypothetical protein
MTLARQMAASPRTIIRKFKLPLDPELLTACQTLAELASIVRQAAATSGVAFAEVGGLARERDRTVIFYDTTDFDLYRNNFMLRKRVSWARDGAACEELVFKFAIRTVIWSRPWIRGRRWKFLTQYGSRSRFSRRQMGAG